MGCSRLDCPGVRRPGEVVRGADARQEADAMPTAFTRPTWLPESLFPFQSRFLDVAGCRIHYVDEGGGPPLLLLHGNPTYSFLYREIIRRLSGRFRCIALDYPGFGLSTAPAGYDFRPATHARVLEEFVRLLGLSGLTLMVQD